MNDLKKDLREQLSLTTGEFSWIQRESSRIAKKNSTDSDVKCFESAWDGIKAENERTAEIVSAMLSTIDYTIWFLESFDKAMGVDNKPGGFWASTQKYQAVTIHPRDVQLIKRGLQVLEEKLQKSKQP